MMRLLYLNGGLVFYYSNRFDGADGVIKQTFVVIVAVAASAC